MPDLRPGIAQTAERRAQIVRLLETRDDNLPTFSRRVHTDSGFRHQMDADVTCPDCFGEDPGRVGCETCRGRGTIIEHRDHDPYAIDQTVKPFGLDGTYLEGVRARDRQIEVMRSQLAPPRKTEADLLEEANKHPFGWESARRAMYARYDYQALDRALDELRLTDQAAYSLLHSTYVYRWLQELSATIEAICARGLDFLSARLPDPLRAPAAARKQEPIVAKLERGAGRPARDARDTRIRELASEGLKPDVIAVRCHVSIRTVYNVVNGTVAA